MSKQKGGYGWIVGFFVLLVLLAGTVTTNYQKSNKIKYLNSQLSTAQQASQQTISNTPSTSTPTVTTPSLIQPSTTKQSWLCSNSLYTGFSSINLDLLCPSSSGGTGELTCTGSISTSLTSSTYQYAPLDMTCTTQ